jgi:hypothetical protein
MTTSAAAEWRLDKLVETALISWGYPVNSAQPMPAGGAPPRGLGDNSGD